MNKGEANSYKTGHRPTETFAELLARVTSNSVVSTVDLPQAPSKRKHSKLGRLVQKAGQLTAKQYTLLMELLESKRTLIVCGGCSYALKHAPDGWYISGLEADSQEHFVDAALTKCSCPDFRFREHVCKHLQAVRESQ